MPQVEAAACGVPVMAVDYSAMSDVVRKLKGTPVKVKALVKEAGTGCDRAVPDNDDFIAKLTALLSLPGPVRRKRGLDARRAAELHYTYDRTAKIWEDHFDSLEPPDRATTWHSPARHHRPPGGVPPGLTDEQFVRWGITHLAGRPDLAGGYLALRMMRDLAWNATLGNSPRSVFNELSMLGTNHAPSPYSREDAARELLGMCGHANYWERERANAPRR